MRIILATLFLPIAVAAQTAEVSGFAGLIAGAGTHPVAGASFGLATSSHLMPVFEFSYMSLGSDILKPPFPITEASTVSDSRAYDFNAGLHILLPVKSIKPVPYLAVGLGAVHAIFNEVHAPFLPRSSGEYSDTRFAFHAGGGLRFHVTDRLGIRPELKIFTGPSTYARLSVGVFYRF